MSSTPLLGDISLERVQHIEHVLEAGFAPTPVVGLEGHVLQRAGRPSQRIRIEGELFGPEAADQLATLQEAAAAGEELTFAADITSALDLAKVVIANFRARERAGHPGRFAYALELLESPPLPPPATVAPFGGLDDFGFGDLGFDLGFADDLLGELGDLASEVASAVDQALDVLDTLQALSNLDGLSLDGLLSPMGGILDGVSGAGGGIQDAGAELQGGLGEEVPS